MVARPHFQVLWPVVCPDAVLMMDGFIVAQWAAQNLRHDQPVLGKPAMLVGVGMVRPVNDHIPLVTYGAFADFASLAQSGVPVVPQSLIVLAAIPLSLPLVAAAVKGTLHVPLKGAAILIDYIPGSVPELIVLVAQAPRQIWPVAPRKRTKRLVVRVAQRATRKRVAVLDPAVIVTATQFRSVFSPPATLNLANHPLASCICINSFILYYR